MRTIANSVGHLSGAGAGTRLYSGSGNKRKIIRFFVLVLLKKIIIQIEIKKEKCLKQNLHLKMLTHKIKINMAFLKALKVRSKIFNANAVVESTIELLPKTKLQEIFVCNLSALRFAPWRHC